MINPDRPDPAAIRADKLRGVWLAIVTDNKDDGQPFRVKVKFPWLPGDEKTYWARIAVPMAGPDRGTYFLPEVDDQVLVVFEHGDVERPIVIGSLWNEKQLPPETNANGKNEIKVIKSKSGHRIIFDDTDGAEKVTVVDSTKKNKVVLDTKEKTVSIESSKDITIKASSGDVIIHGKNVKMTSKTGGIKAEATGVMTVATSGAINMKADATMTIGSKVTMQMAGASAKGGKGGAKGAGQKGNQAKEQVKDKAGSAAGGGRPRAGGGSGGRSRTFPSR